MVILNLPASERAAVWRLFWYCLLTGSSYILARTAGDSLFLARLGPDDLSWVFVYSGIATWIGGSLWFFCVRQLPLERLLVTSTLMLGLCSLLAWWFLPSLHHSFAWLAMIYILAEIKGCLNAINVIVALNEVFGGRASRQAWAAGLLGFPAASLVGGALIGWESQFIGVADWLWIAALLDLLALVPIWWITHHQVPGPSSSDLASEADEDVAELLPADEAQLPRPSLPSRRLAFWMAWFVGLQVVVLTLTNYQWKTELSDYFGDHEETLSMYFGYFYSGLGLATLAIQLWLTSALLRHRRAWLLLVLPTALLVLILVFLSGPGLLWGVAILTTAKAWDAWRRSVHDTTVYWIYTRVRRAQRRGLIGHNLAIIKPLAEVATGVCLIVLPVLGWFLIWVAAGIGWLLVTVQLTRRLRRRSRQHRGTPLLVKQLAAGLPDNH